ncbi:MAG: hypothetical protein J6A47_10150 [Bacilli bacterium]|nr:hypothetical protein [Bacilli bacterium]
MYNPRRAIADDEKTTGRSGEWPQGRLFSIVMLAPTINTIGFSIGQKRCADRIHLSAHYITKRSGTRKLKYLLYVKDAEDFYTPKEYFDNGSEDFFSFLSDGSLPLDSNRAERASTLMTLLENALLRGLDAEGYLT